MGRTRSFLFCAWSIGAIGCVDSTPPPSGDAGMAETDAGEVDIDTALDRACANLMAVDGDLQCGLSAGDTCRRNLSMLEHDGCETPWESWVVCLADILDCGACSTERDAIITCLDALPSRTDDACAHLAEIDPGNGCSHRFGWDCTESLEGLDHPRCASIGALDCYETASQCDDCAAQNMEAYTCRREAYAADACDALADLDPDRCGLGSEADCLAAIAENPEATCGDLYIDLSICLVDLDACGDACAAERAALDACHERGF
jgi:hypothetical protein